MAHGIISYHDWWKRRGRRSRMKARPGELGLNGLVFGHDPDALGFSDTIAMDPDGWLIKPKSIDPIREPL